MLASPPLTPLCPAGHLPHKGGDWLTRRSALILRRQRLVSRVYEGVISPLVGEMPGRAEGGETANAPILVNRVVSA
ncbi:hypothetical protein GCM10011491_01990 [Brucella endophytica]|uniref:Lytic murein transglycosylase n=1 Tax=Brucella endophytica TaxID=1963359 RepID=A0A916S2G2_9HYPH|nr:hypothetical protein GCM10011491_01990 [Brucella endophytica]